MFYSKLLQRSCIAHFIIRIKFPNIFMTTLRMRTNNREHNTHINYSTRSLKDTFVGEVDRYNGITISCGNEEVDQEYFKEKLEESLSKWDGEGRRCIWFKVNIVNSSLVPVLAQKGFNFHHARDDFVMMYKWLPKNPAPNLPPCSHVNLGVGAMVFNSMGKLLAISEKNYDYPHWKLPGGYVERGEDIVNAAVREVKEETGVDCEFQSLVTFRHTHNMMFGNSDIYVLLMMKALTEKITISQREIKACQWMDVEEYTNHPHVHNFNRMIINKALEYKSKNIKLDIQKKTVKWSTFVREMNFLLVGKFQ